MCINCLGHCKDGAFCNTSTGGCDGGCGTNWEGRYCQGYYQHVKISCVNVLHTQFTGSYSILYNRGITTKMNWNFNCNIYL